MCRSDADSTHSKLCGTGRFPLLSWGWRGVPKLLKLPEMEPRGTLGKDMTVPACPCICLSTCEKPTASHRHYHYHHDDHHHHCRHCHRYLQSAYHLSGTVLSTLHTINSFTSHNSSINISSKDEESEKKRSEITFPRSPPEK